MEAFNRTFQQFSELYKSMSASQRGTLIAVPVMIVIAFGIVLYSGQSSSYSALSWGKVFDSEQLMTAEQTLIQAGMTDFRREGQRIMVPKGQVDQYNAALVAEGGMPNDSAREWELQIDKSSVFTSSQQRAEYKKIALMRMLRRVIRAVPDIEDADVLWAESNDRPRWPETSKVTATVYVQPRHGREITTRLVQSLRASVAGTIPDLKREDITIFDQSTGIAHTPDEAGQPYDSRLLTHIKQFERSNQEKISRALSHIDNAMVTVSVSIDNLKRHVERTQTVDKKTVEVLNKTRTRDRTSTQRRQRAEAGLASNTPIDLNSQDSPNQSQSVKEQTTESTSIPSFTTFEKEYTAGMPKAVTVNVSIPDDYFEAIALKQGLTKGETDQEKADFKRQLAAIETDETSKVKATLATLLKDSPPEAINVRSFVNIPDDTKPAEISVVHQIATGISQWGSAVGLAIFALWSLWMLNKSMSKVSAEDATDTDALLAAATAEDDDEDSVIKKPKEPSKRDRLQIAVRDNPELTAAVLSKWIQAAK